MTLTFLSLLDFQIFYGYLADETCKQLGLVLNNGAWLQEAMCPGFLGKKKDELVAKHKTLYAKNPVNSRTSML